MRQIFLDTETTGLSHAEGDRVIEIGCVDFRNRQITGRNFHHYINPERDSHPEALAVHGITTEFLSDKPKFEEIAEAFCDYIRGAELFIHNAPFDVGFLNAELERLGMPRVEALAKSVTDTLAMARDMYPGRSNRLDALCERLEVDNTHRTLHGALVDAALLGDVYLAMTRGQESLGIDLIDEIDMTNPANAITTPILVRALKPEEEADHETYLDEIAKKSKRPVLWRELSKEQ